MLRHLLQDRRSRESSRTSSAKSRTQSIQTSRGRFISAEEKAYREAIKAVVGKQAQDRTLDEQKAATADIAKNSSSSVVHAKAEAAMKARTL